MTENSTSKSDYDAIDLGPEPTSSRHAFWGVDPSGYCSCGDCEPRRVPPTESAHGCVVEDGRCLTASHDHVYVTPESIYPPAAPKEGDRG